MCEAVLYRLIPKLSPEARRVLLATALRLAEAPRHEDAQHAGSDAAVH